MHHARIVTFLRYGALLGDHLFRARSSELTQPLLLLPDSLSLLIFWLQDGLPLALCQISLPCFLLLGDALRRVAFRR